MLPFPNVSILTLALARAAGVAWTAPGLSTRGLDARSRCVLAVVLAAVVAPAIVDDSPSRLTWMAIASEALVGAGLGWSAALIVAGARQGGELVAAQAGLSAATLFDPEAGEEISALGQLYGLVALGVFLALDGPLALVRALVESYRVIPAGRGQVLTEGAAIQAFGRVGEALALALRAAAPVALALTLAGVALGLLGRAAPSLQRLATAMPIRAALGLVLVLLGLATLAGTLAAAWSAWPGDF